MASHLDWYIRVGISAMIDYKYPDTNNYTLSEQLKCYKAEITAFCTAAHVYW